MSGTITALTAGVTPTLFFAQLTAFVPFLLVIIPIAVGWRLLMGAKNKLSKGKIN